MKRTSAAEWARHFSNFQTSGMSITDYCKKYRLSESRWKFWQRKLSEKDPVEQFVPVIANETGIGTPLSIQMANGVSLSFREDVNLTRLASIIRALKGLQP